MRLWKVYGKQNWKIGRWADWQITNTKSNARHPQDVRAFCFFALAVTDDSLPSVSNQRVCLSAGPNHG
jgi:hypothetical protein